jgi:two-component system, NarL family, nitrate/nitrite response regulator NarL
VDVKPVRTVVVGEIRFYREGLSQVLGRQPTIDIVGTGCTTEDALTWVAEQRPDVVLVDDGLPNAQTLIGRISGGERQVSVLAINVHEDERAVLACVEAGAAGFLPPQASLAEVIAAVTALARGEFHFPPRMTAMLLRRVTRPSAHNELAGDGMLTRREHEVVDLIEGGLSNKEIAWRLSISIATVKNHVHNILHKLDVGTRKEAVARMRALRTPSYGPSHS